jgi:hypothetical protein
MPGEAGHGEGCICGSWDNGWGLQLSQIEHFTTLLLLLLQQVEGTMATCLNPMPAWDQPINPGPSSFEALLPDPAAGSNGGSNGGSSGGRAAALAAAGCSSRTASWRDHGVMYGKCDGHPGLHMTSCGHMAHTTCWEQHGCVTNGLEIAHQTLLQSRCLTHSTLHVYSLARWAAVVLLYVLVLPLLLYVHCFDQRPLLCVPPPLNPTIEPCCMCTAKPCRSHAQARQLAMSQLGVTPGAPAPHTHELLCPLCR